MKEKTTAYGLTTRPLIKIQVWKLYFEIGWVVKVYHSLTELSKEVSKQLDSFTPAPKRITNKTDK